MGSNIWHCPVCGLEEDQDSDFEGTETHTCSNGHSTTYIFGSFGSEEPSYFNCPICGKTHILYDHFDDYPIKVQLDFDRGWNSGFFIFHWGM